MPVLHRLVSLLVRQLLDVSRGPVSILQHSAWQQLFKLELYICSLHARHHPGSYIRRISTVICFAEHMISILLYAEPDDR